MAQNVHVPKFGDWESEDIPYTAFFDHARDQIKPSGSVKINPNDPEENPEAYGSIAKTSSKRSASASSKLRRSEEQTIVMYTKRNDTSSSSGHGVLNDGLSSRSEYLGHKGHWHSSANQSFDLDYRHHEKAASIPKFGSWDVNDPTSGEGFSIIFNRIKQEKKAINASAYNLPPPQTNYFKDQNKQRKSSCLFKICCCLF